MQMPSVKTMNCDSDVKIILNQYKQQSGNSHNVCVCICEWLGEVGMVTFENLVGLTTADTVGRKSLACDCWLPSMYKN